MNPTSNELAVAVDAAARHVVDHNTNTDDAFDHLDPFQQLQAREQVLDLVGAILTALPDRAPAAAAQARADVVAAVRAHCCTCHGVDHRQHEDWCPAAAVNDILDEAPA